MIFTFYSYKGGTGRSMALANVAKMLFDQGMRVLIVDWDLEAPGVERFLPIDVEKVHSSLGVIDLLLDYKQKMGSKSQIQVETDVTKDFVRPEDCVIDVYPHHRGDGRLLLLHSGKRDGENFTEYAHEVTTFDWVDFYEKWEGGLYIEFLSSRFREMADVILVDSRTGVNEISGICTYHLADVVVMLCAPNKQNLDGCQMIARQLTTSNVAKDRLGRKLELIIVPARIEDRAEVTLLNEFRFDFESTFNVYISEKLKSTIKSFWELRIPHVPFFSFREFLAVDKEAKSYSDALDLSYSKIVASMAAFANRGSKLQELGYREKFKLGNRRRIEVPNEVANRQVGKEREHVRPTRIAIWGPTFSGKTWLLHALVRSLSIVEKEGNEFYYKLVDEFGYRVNADDLGMIAPTSLVTDNVFEFQRLAKDRDYAHVISSHAHQIMIHDAPGFLLTELEEPIVEMTLSNTTGVILVFDVTSANIWEGRIRKYDSIELPNKVRNEDLDVATSRFGRDEYVSSVYRLLRLLETGSEQRRIAICLTKCDLISGFLRSPMEILSIYFGEDMVKLLDLFEKRTGNSIKVFATSSAGFLGRGEWLPNYDPTTGYLKDVSQWTPVNVAAPFFWMLEFIERERLGKVFGPIFSNFLSRKRLEKYIPYPSFNPFTREGFKG